MTVGHSKPASLFRITLQNSQHSNRGPYSELLCKISTIFTPQIPHGNRHYSVLYNGKKTKMMADIVVPATEFSHDFLCFWRWQFEPNRGIWNKTMCCAFWTRVLIRNNCAKKPLFIAMTLYITPSKCIFLITDFGVRPANSEFKFLIIKGSLDILIPNPQTSNLLRPPLNHNTTRAEMPSFSA